MPRDARGTEAREEKVVEISFYITIHFKSGTTYLWTGRGNRTINGKEYIGAANLLALKLPEESPQISAQGASITLSGVPSELVARAGKEEIQDRLCVIEFACVEPGVTPTELMAAFRGKMEAADVSYTKTSATITINVESNIRGIRRTYPVLYSAPTHRLRYPGDSSFDGVTDLPELWQHIRWGQGTPA